MRRYGPTVLLLLSAAAILRISLFSGLYLRYVQPGLRPFLIASGVLLAVLGVAAGVRVLRADDHEDDGEGDGGHDHEGDHEGDGGHDHDHGPAGPRVAWLLAVPALALLLFPPPALGSYSAEQQAAEYAARGVGTFDPLPKGDPVELTLGEFSSRAIYDSRRSLKGRTVRMTGFVTQEKQDKQDKGEDGTWYLTRLLVSCCAADASPYKVEIRGADVPPAEAWVTVTGTWHPEGKLGSEEAWPPVLDAESVKRVAEPENPYEKR
ncbi:TIGR03943 family putative permease subunit [Streptomyces ipomoeae]|uniref:TIGR03943 family putative permease subunit n=1 Tax=Streptomyces ipomoeae TaxID=103232 RepID=UPI001147452F|nr:TIGR03943 family protein [Streptomyces ipomoeae]MDX2932351.1 TIGR03943 family protein [Streptomyces ipomoeae]TQE27137.1 TIGR03943 family protein [Streptomyces ipomoeae]